MSPDQKQKLIKITNKFRDLDAALEMNAMLIELEREDPREFHILFGRLLALTRERREYVRPVED